MSEWKWCLECGHHYEAHEPKDFKAPCVVEGCDCERFVQEVANFL